MGNLFTTINHLFILIHAISCIPLDMTVLHVLNYIIEKL